MLGSGAPVDYNPRQIEIINQVMQDPTSDGLISTTPQAGDYDDIVETMLKRGVPVATTNSYDPALAHRSEVGHTGQDASAAAIDGAALARCVLESGADGGTIIFPNNTTLGTVEVNTRITAAFDATVKAWNAAAKLADF